MWCQEGSDSAASHPAAPLAKVDLDDDDLALLIRYVNPTYLSEDSWPKIQARFEEEGSIQLQVLD